MPQRKQQSFLQGAMILMTATLLVKLIGALFKIPLTNIIGPAGMGYFNVAYGLFNTLYALSLAGLPVAVAKLVAESAAQRRYRDVRRIHTISTVLFLLTGSVGALLMLFGARPYVRFCKNEGALPALLVMAPSILFVCLTSSFRGYYEGLRNMYPTALSQLVEALTKLFLGLFFAKKMLEKGMKDFALFGTVFGKAVPTLAHARLAALPYAAAGAVGGIALSIAAGTLFLFLRHRLLGDGLSTQELALSPPPQSTRMWLARLVGLALPVCLGALVMSITTLIDVSSITNRLAEALQRNPAAVLQRYQSLLPAETALSGVPNYLYGTYTMALNVFHLVPAITTAFGVSALPVIASTWASHDWRMLQRSVESVLRLTALVAFPAGLGLCVLARPVLLLLYPGAVESAQIAVPMLRALGLAAVFVSLASPLASMLQAVDCAQIPVRLMLLGGSVKLIINYTFLAVPQINIQAAPYGTLCCYALILLLELPALCKGGGIRLNIWRMFGKPFLAAIFCAAGAWQAYGFFSREMRGNAPTLLAILFAMVFYVVLLLLLRVVTKDDVCMLPKGEKIAKTLEKYHVIG